VKKIATAVACLALLVPASAATAAKTDRATQKDVRSICRGGNDVFYAEWFKQAAWVYLYGGDLKTARLMLWYSAWVTTLCATR
jgi:hypothetical protein